MERIAQLLFPCNPDLSVFAGKRIVFTGAATGLGAEAVKRLASEGCRLVLIDVNDEALQKTAEECRKLSTLGEDNVSVIVADLSELRSVRLVRAAIRFLGGGIDYLFLNHLGARGGTGALSGATFLPSMPLTDEVLKSLVDTNITATIQLVRDFIPFLLESSGSIVFTASSGATLRLPFLSMYSLLKQGMIAFLESLRQELKLLDNSPGIAITICYLNAVGTETFYRQVGKDQPIQIEAPPEQISPPKDAALFLIQSAAARKEDAYGPLPGLWAAKVLAQLIPRTADSLTRRIPSVSAAAKKAALLDYARIKASIVGSGASTPLLGQK